MKKPIIFCDFDGTITNSDNIVSLMKRFAPKEWEQIKDNILAQNLSIREGVGQMFHLIPSSRKKDLLDYLLATTEIRQGFAEFVHYTKQEGIQLYVVSGGIDFFVYPLLNPFEIPEENIFCNGSDFTNETITITWPYSCDGDCTNDCGCCKPGILKQFDGDTYRKIVIGDSITDLEVAKQADQVFARDYLAKKCKELSIPAVPFESFHDIVRKLTEEKEGYDESRTETLERTR
ncbi:2-hydroxy-3-keto-5-methylthiopentenyl-1-phosphate phosphatase [Bacillus hwajinpoensis]|uniref:2-hydroxy-3-keto-5-methylthiopentenyl-1-phosphate phosphatase n=1 Tax=Guptibacillus hwajinpoensis TaxID=208199 RepID=A0A845F4I7_9BACL|nr:2-hydroxy-3-keto-5-methylthiopentenyl-1-phosphate phosphatase [Pseudalkalibacillus hwajinpoensis]MYL65648.1 2-hydroxy-3-keto-5-methylthiopentenyl-1-phosphate phosphatase [Pseudalkalibacillus hwajinpoensis]